MKKIGLLFSFFTILFLSCSDDNNSQQVDISNVLLKKIITYTPATSYETIFTYDGKKIIEARNNRENKKFQYNGDNISKISWYSNPNTSNELSKYVEFSYLPDGKLSGFSQHSYYPLEVQFTYAENDIVNFTAYNASGSYTFVGYFKMMGTEISEYIYLNGGNPRPSVKYLYDDKNHPLKNVTGYNKLSLFHYFYNSAHFNGFTTNVGSAKNCISNSLINDPSVIEVMNTYEYNELGFPKTINKDSETTADHLFY
jgi:hypothetical protein